MQLHAAFMAVPDPEHVDLVAVQTGEDELVEGVHDGLLLFFLRVVVLVESDHWFSSAGRQRHQDRYGCRP